MTFALENPHAYKLMFDFNQPHAEKYPELVAAGQRAQQTMTGYVEDAIAEGLMAGDPQQIGLMFWAAIHGAVILELAGMLPPGGARELYRGLDATLMRGMRPARTDRRLDRPGGKTEVSSPSGRPPHAADQAVRVSWSEAAGRGRAGPGPRLSLAADPGRPRTAGPMAATAPV